MPTNTMFDIVKFCQKHPGSAQNNGVNSCTAIQYSKVVTSGNDPSMSKSMRYSQLVKNAKPNTVINYTPDNYTTPRNGTVFIKIQPRYQYGDKPFSY
jgi:hypothetical protein